MWPNNISAATCYKEHGKLICTCIQWNLFTADIHHWDPSNCPDLRGVLISGVVLGLIQVSIIERCPYFRGGCIEGFHCIFMCIGIDL